jgi:hypothetical protein
MDNRYHLWLKPSSKASSQFADIIQRLSLELKAPTFEPHITLLGNLNGSEAEQVARSKELARRLSPFPIHVREPAFGEDYFHCVFLIADMTPPLLHAHTLACEIFRERAESICRTSAWSMADTPNSGRATSSPGCLPRFAFRSRRVICR